jgi:acyl-coenzyme A synthetase/AMP-(fatty) acid ligase
LTPARGGEVLLHCDDSYAFAVGLLAIAHAGARAGDPGAALPRVDREAPLAVLFTSDTTGEARRIEKAVRHVEEVAVLEEHFGAQLGADTRILATVAPQHLYGLLFRVLWPIASGRGMLEPRR